MKKILMIMVLINLAGCSFLTRDRLAKEKELKALKTKCALIYKRSNIKENNKNKIIKVISPQIEKHEGLVRVEIERNVSKITKCYQEKVDSKEITSPGMSVIKFKITPDGMVKDKIQFCAVNEELYSLKSCVERSLMDSKFPERDGTTTITQPINFKSR